MAPSDAIARDRALLEYSSEFLVFVDAEGRVVVGAGEGLMALGYGPTDQAGVHISSLIHPDDVGRATELVERAWADPVRFRETIRLRVRHRDGGWLPLEVAVFTVVDAVLGPGAVLRVRKLSGVGGSAAPDIEEQRFLSLAESLPTGVLTLELDGRVAYANRAAARILGIVPADLDEWIALVDDDDRDELREAVVNVREADVHEESTFRMERGPVPRWVHATVIRAAAGGDEVLLVAVEDVTDQLRAANALALQATHDPLTGLPNRTLLTDRLAQAVARLGRDAECVAVLFLDLDGFKPVNDDHGHHAGDEVLKAVAHRIRAQVRPGDTVARYGGDEFVVLATDLVPEGAEALARRIERAVGQPVAYGGRELTVTTTIGVATATRPTTAEQLLAEADVDMYRRKRR